MAASNHPEKPFFDKIVVLESEIAERRIDIKALYDNAKEDEAIGKDGVKVLRKAVKRHMENADKRASREAAESAADQLLARLGHLHDTPLGQAAMRSAAE